MNLWGFVHFNLYYLLFLLYNSRCAFCCVQFSCCIISTVQFILCNSLCTICFLFCAIWFVQSAFCHMLHSICFVSNRLSCFEYVAGLFWISWPKQELWSFKKITRKFKFLCKGPWVHQKYKLEPFFFFPYYIYSRYQLFSLLSCVSVCLWE